MYTGGTVYYDGTTEECERGSGDADKAPVQQGRARSHTSANHVVVKEGKHVTRTRK